MTLEEHLRKAREDAKLTINEVAKTLKLGRAQIWRMEKSADFIPVGRLRELADLYGRPLPSFFDDSFEVNSKTISYQIIGMAMAAVEEVAGRMPERPTPKAMQGAVIAVIRIQQDRWTENPKAIFKPEEFNMLVEDHFRKEAKK